MRGKLSRTIQDDYHLSDKIKDLAKRWKHLASDERDQMVRELKNLSDRADQHADLFLGGKGIASRPPGGHVITGRRTEGVQLETEERSITPQKLR